MNEVPIQIFVVKNGYLLVLPAQQKNMFAGLAEVMPGRDELLHPKKTDEIVARADNALVFFSWGELCGYLKTLDL